MFAIATGDGHHNAMFVEASVLVNAFVLCWLFQLLRFGFYGFWRVFMTGVFRGRLIDAFGCAGKSRHGIIDCPWSRYR